MINKKTSLLINRQVPEFVREEHPKFISFLEAYYEFLDNSSYGKAKELKNISDVDQSLDEFEQQFFNSFMPFIPRNAALNKETLIKNIMPLYLAKGSESGYKLLFRMLFDEEVQIEYPGRQILRASDGRWTVENLLTTEPEIYSEYISDGTRQIYYLPYSIDSKNISIYVNDSLITTGYLIFKESKKIVFDDIPPLNSHIRVYYNNFDLTVLNHRRLIGKTSGATAIIEKTGKQNIGSLNIFQFFINQKSVAGTFLNGEIVECDLVAEDGSLMPFYFLTFCEVDKINIVYGGSGYNVGDPVIVRGPSTQQAVAIVNDIATGYIEQLTISNYGAGYQVDTTIIANEFSEEYFLAKTQTIDDSGIVSSNTVTINTDIVENFADLSISGFYNFDAFPEANITTIISEALTSNTIINLGGITSLEVVNSLISSNVNPTIVAVSPIAFGNTRLDQLGVIGQIDIISGGINYEIGDQLRFINIDYFGGQGATGEVLDTDANGAITSVLITSGGLGYNKKYFPRIDVVSENGSGANLIVRFIMGSGAEFIPIIEEGVQGEILSIAVLESGGGFTGVPGIDLTKSGNGDAIAEATIRSSLRQLPGKWKTLDGLLSNDQIRLQGQDYYIDYSYVLSSKVEFEKYKNVLKNLIHPAGLINYARFRIQENITVTLENEIDSTVSFNETFIGSDTTLITVDTTEFKADYS